MSTERLTRVQEIMQQQGLMALVIMPGANLRYLTGLTFHASERLTLALFPADGSLPCLVLPRMEAARAEVSTDIPLQIFPWDDATGPAQALHDATRKLFQAQIVRIGVEYTAMRVMELRALESCAAQLQTVDAIPLMAGLRMRKSQHELAAMTRAAQIIEQALATTLPQIKVGATERQIAMFLASAIIAAGGEGESFSTIIASGPHSAHPHHITSERALVAGDLVIVDAGAFYQGYASDITRTVALGEPGEQARTIYNLVLQANSAGRAALRPGVSGEQIDQAARQVIADGGYSAYFMHRTGHGLGLECHELPDIVAGSTQPLLSGTTFTIEPGIYVEGVGGVRIEDDVVITEDGGSSLTNFSRELMILP